MEASTFVRFKEDANPLFPVQNPLPDGPHITDQQKGKKHSGIRHTEPSPMPVANRPGEQKNGLHVEDHEEHRNEKEADGIADLGIQRRFDSTLISG